MIDAYYLLYSFPLFYFLWELYSLFHHLSVFSLLPHFDILRLLSLSLFYLSDRMSQTSTSTDSSVITGFMSLNYTLV